MNGPQVDTGDISARVARSLGSRIILGLVGMAAAVVLVTGLVAVFKERGTDTVGLDDMGGVDENTGTEERAGFEVWGTGAVGIEFGVRVKVRVGTDERVRVDDMSTDPTAAPEDVERGAVPLGEWLPLAM